MEAIEAIATERDSDELRQALIALREDLARMSQPTQVDLAFSGDGSAAQETAKPRLDLPVGLENIGNTCYLNSILQYLNTVVPVKTLLAHYSEYELGLDDEKIQSRFVGGNKLKIDRAEAVVARVCEFRVPPHQNFGFSLT